MNCHACVFDARIKTVAATIIHFVLYRRMRTRMRTSYRDKDTPSKLASSGTFHTWAGVTLVLQTSERYIADCILNTAQLSSAEVTSIIIMVKYIVLHYICNYRYRLQLS